MKHYIFVYMFVKIQKIMCNAFQDQMKIYCGFFELFPLPSKHMSSNMLFLLMCNDLQQQELGFKV